MLSANFIDTEFSAEQSINISTIRDDFTVMLQTDKPKYKPGDRLNMRLFFVRPSGKPVSTEKLKNFHIEIRNSYGEPIWSDGTAEYEVKVYTYQMILNEEALTGNYTIFVWTNFKAPEKNDHFEPFEISKTGLLQTHDASLQQYFVVEKYVLPEFELNISTEKQIARPWNDIVVRIHAEYSFGKYVLGKAQVRAALNGENFYSEEVSVNYEGFAVIRLKKDLIRESSKNEVKVDVEFEDLLSRRKLSKSLLVPVQKSIQKTVVLDPTTNLKFKPGQSFSMNVYVKDIDGNFLENSNDFIKMSVDQSYKGHKCEEITNMLEFSNRLELKPRKLINGVAQFVIEDIPFNTSAMSFKAKYENFEANYIVGRSLTSSHQYLKVSAE